MGLDWGEGGGGGDFSTVGKMRSARAVPLSSADDTRHGGPERHAERPQGREKDKQKSKKIGLGI